MDGQGNVKPDIPVADYDKHLVERAIDWSYMKPVYVIFDGAEQMYRVGALARVNLAESFNTPVAQAEFEAFRGTYGRPCHLTVLQIYTQLIELIHSCERAKVLVADKAIMGESRVPA